MISNASTTKPGSPSEAPPPDIPRIGPDAERVDSGPPNARKTAPVCPEEAPGLSSFLRRHWDEGLLIAVLLALTVMLGYVLWPPPRAVLMLRPLPVSRQDVLASRKALSPTEASPLSGEAAGESVETLPSLETSGNATSITAEPRRKSLHRRDHGSHRAKKPEHPPILNLNQASSTQLQLLPGIGPKMAERILEYRRTHGRFAEPAQIMDVKGIGSKKFEKLKPYLKV